MIGNRVLVTADIGCQFSVRIIFEGPAAVPFDLVERSDDLHVHADSRQHRQLRQPFESIADRDAAVAAYCISSLPAGHRVAGVVRKAVTAWISMLSADPSTISSESSDRFLSACCQTAAQSPM